MALRSMTGFGAARLQLDGARVDVESKSFNRKRLDPRVKLPDALGAVEPPIREAIKARCNRGRVEVAIEVEMRPGAEAETGGFLDADRFNLVRRQLHELAKRSATGPVELGDILEFKELFEREQPVELGDHEDEILAAAEEALDDLVDARTREGEGIERDLLDHLETLDDDLRAYSNRVPDEMDELREGIRRRVTDALEDFDGAEPDEQRLAEEIVYHTDRADTSEERQRAASHIESLHELITDSPVDEAVGKEVDFYLQELVRETNTLASKSHSAELTDLAVSMKSSVEKMREQAANVE